MDYLAACIREAEGGESVVNEGAARGQLEVGSMTDSSK